MKLIAELDDLDLVKIHPGKRIRSRGRDRDIGDPADRLSPLCQLGTLGKWKSVASGCKESRSARAGLKELSTVHVFLSDLKTWIS